MTQIVSVSAQTAHYASDMMQGVRKNQRGTPVEEHTRLLAERAAKSDDFNLRAMMTVIRPPALALYWLTANLQKIPETTVEEAITAYRGTAGE